MEITKLYKIDNIDLENDFQKYKLDSNPFPIEIYSKHLLEIIFKVSEIYGFSLDYICSCILSAASTAIGNSHKVYMKRGWEVKANLFMVIVGRSGDAKSPTLNFCYKPIQMYDSAYYQEYEKKVELYDKQKDQADEKKPFPKKYLINDFTPEALMKTLLHNKKGICVFVDELNGWLKNFNRYNNSGEVEMYLSFWSGNTISIDRASGKSLRIDDPFINVIGGAQIGILKEFFKNDKSVNGFVERLLFVYPDELGEIKWSLEDIDPIYLENYNSIIDNLINRSSKKEKHLLPLSKKAQKTLFDWKNNRDKNYFFDYERSTEVKLEEYVIRFSLILQLLDDACNNKESNEIKETSVIGAIKLYKYFKYNAIKVRLKTVYESYYENLTDLQKQVYKELPDEFKTAEGVLIATKKVNGKSRISERSFKTFLRDKKLFKKISRGIYSKLL